MVQPAWTWASRPGSIGGEMLRCAVAPSIRCPSIWIAVWKRNDRGPGAKSRAQRSVRYGATGRASCASLRKPCGQGAMIESLDTTGWTFVSTVKWVSPRELGNQLF